MTSSLSIGSSSHSKNEGNQEWENHVIMRFPLDIAQKIKQYLDEDAHHGHDSRLSLSFNQNLRTGTVKFDKHEMDFTLYDLPCITEVLKTLDNKTVYKVADLAQIIICSPPAGQKRRELQHDDLTDENKEKQDEYEWPHGLCPPMRNARQKRFRKVKKKKYMDAVDVERELKRLLRSDLEASSVRWEVISTDELDKDNENRQESRENQSQIEPEPEDIYDYGGLSLSESEDDLA